MEILYNGIEFNEKWLVADHGKSMLETLPVPYLENPPEIKPIDIGRQLFVDDFLIEKTDMYRVFHQPETRDLPVLFPQTEVELNHGYCPVAAPFDDACSMMKMPVASNFGIMQDGSGESDMLRARMVFTGKG